MTRPRAMKARRSGLVSCGHHVMVGQRIVQRAGGWVCLPCALANPIEHDDSTRKGPTVQTLPAKDQAAMLAALALDEWPEVVGRIRNSRYLSQARQADWLARVCMIQQGDDGRAELISLIVARAPERPAEPPAEPPTPSPGPPPDRPARRRTAAPK